MSVTIIQERLSHYQCKSTLEEENALREITQEVILAGLGRTNFFQTAGFLGGTCLRIFHGLNRFSENLDFALSEPDLKFSLVPYLKDVCRELDAYGYDLEIEDRSKAERAVKQAFLKDQSIGKLLHLNYRLRTGPMRKIRINLEIDANPPLGATYETPVLDFPFPSAVRVFDLASLFAGKIHALLCRTYLKGRDWYDFVWYTARKTPVNHSLLSTALDQQGPWQHQHPESNNAWCSEQLRKTIETTNWQQATQDVARFVKPHELPSLQLWSTDFFLQQLAKIHSPPTSASLPHPTLP